MTVCLGFKLSGVALPAAQKERFRAISQELSQLTSRFSDNVLDATNAWTKQILDVNELAGLPESALEMAAQTAQAARYGRLGDYPAIPLLLPGDDVCG